MKWYLLVTLLISCFLSLPQDKTMISEDYGLYHVQINKAEGFIGEEDYAKALEVYEETFKSFFFVFLRDYKVAAQIAFYMNDKEMAFDLITRGLASGWELKALKKEKFLSPLQKEPRWNYIQNNYDSLHRLYLKRIDPIVRDRVHALFKKDQKKAMGALFKIGNKAQEKYGSEKFAPHSEEQMAQLFIIMDTLGYPGEKHIGNDYWMSTIISHHNSISEEYVRKDTLFDYIRPALKKALTSGEISPYEYALVEDWRLAVLSNRTAVGYGFINPPLKITLGETNALREKAGLRSVQLRNKLVDIEEKTGMNLYLPDWVEGKIEVEE